MVVLDLEDLRKDYEESVKRLVPSIFPSCHNHFSRLLVRHPRQQSLLQVHGGGRTLPHFLKDVMVTTEKTRECQFPACADRLEDVLQKIHLALDAQIRWYQGQLTNSMPIKSHYYILLGSLSILAGFAAVVRYIDHVLPK